MERTQKRPVVIHDFHVKVRKLVGMGYLNLSLRIRILLWGDHKVVLDELENYRPLWTTTLGRFTYLLGIATIVNDLHHDPSLVVDRFSRELP